MLVPIQFRPGINKENTEYADGGTFVDCDHVRFWQGEPQSIGGWSSAAQEQFDGVCRGLLVYEDLQGGTNIAVGTHIKLMIWRGGRFFDVTPIRRSVIVSNPFQTAAGSSIVTVKDPAHGAITGDTVQISNADLVSGVAIDGQYVVLDVQPNSYTIDAGITALGSTTGGGAAVHLDYNVTIGSLSGGNGTGFGTGTFGRGTFGTPRSGVPRLQRTTRTWSFDAWGEDLVANFTGGGIYMHDTSGGTGNRAQAIFGAPQFAECIRVSDSRQIIAYGAELNGIQDRMLVRWCTIENFTDWTPSLENSAGSQRLQGGSRIMNAVKARGDLYVFSDTDLFLQRFTGAPLIFEFQKIGGNGELIADKAVVEMDNIIYWMGRDNFFAYDGRIVPIPCPVRSYVFNAIQASQRTKIHAGVNPAFKEIWWFYVSAGSSEIDSYVVFAPNEGTWTVGKLERTAWADGRKLGFPLATDIDGNLFFQESGETANGDPLHSYIRSGFVELGQGDEFIFFDKIIPDFLLGIDGTVELTVAMRRYPNAAETTKGPLLVTADTEKISVRGRARQVALTIESDSKWRMGKPRVNINPDGAKT